MVQVSFVAPPRLILNENTLFQRSLDVPCSEKIYRVGEVGVHLMKNRTGWDFIFPLDKYSINFQRLTELQPTLLFGNYVVNAESNRLLRNLSSLKDKEKAQIMFTLQSM